MDGMKTASIGERTAEKLHDEKLIYISKMESFAKIIDLEVAPLIEALREVQNLRREDEDKNFVCWVGEGTFQRIESALAKAAPVSSLEKEECSQGENKNSPV